MLGVKEWGASKLAVHPAYHRAWHLAILDRPTLSNQDSKKICFLNTIFQLPHCFASLCISLLGCYS